MTSCSCGKLLLVADAGRAVRVARRGDAAGERHAEEALGGARGGQETAEARRRRGRADVGTRREQTVEPGGARHARGQPSGGLREYPRVARGRPNPPPSQVRRRPLLLHRDQRRRDTTTAAAKSPVGPAREEGARGVGEESGPVMGQPT